MRLWQRSPKHFSYVESAPTGFRFGINPLLKKSLATAVRRWMKKLKSSLRCSVAYRRNLTRVEPYPLYFSLRIARLSRTLQSLPLLSWILILSGPAAANCAGRSLNGLNSAVNLRGFIRDRWSGVLKNLAET